MLGMVATNTGKRPSELFNWNDEEDWFGRLMFDMKVLQRFKEAEAEAIKNGSPN